MLFATWNLKDGDIVWTKTRKVVQRFSGWHLRTKTQLTMPVRTPRENFSEVWRRFECRLPVLLAVMSLLETFWTLTWLYSQAVTAIFLVYVLGGLSLIVVAVRSWPRVRSLIGTFVRWRASTSSLMIWIIWVSVVLHDGLFFAARSARATSLRVTSNICLLHCLNR